MEDENYMIKFENNEGTQVKINIIKDVVNWLCHEMQQGRVNNNKLVLQYDIKKTEQRVTTPLSIAFVKMAEKGEIDEVTASENADFFLEWDEKSTHKAGSIKRRNGLLYQCLQEHTGQAGWEPENTPALWKQFSINENGIPNWSQPISSVDTYMLNDETMHNDLVWVSDYDNNVWEPGAFGWHVKEETIEAPSSGDN